LERWSDPARYGKGIRLGLTTYNQFMCPKKIRVTMADFPGLSYLDVANRVLQPGSIMYLLEHEPAQISPERENKRHLDGSTIISPPTVKDLRSKHAPRGALL
jgi:hypothetical protein